MRKLLIRCPICGSHKLIPIPREIFEIEEGNLLKLPIREGAVCEHRFLVILDFHFSIRDYEAPSEENGYLEKYFMEISYRKIL